MTQRAGTLEVHTHHYLGRDWSMRSRDPNKPDIEHAHEGGDRPHLHPDCGPATYTIDKDVWAAATRPTRGRAVATRWRGWNKASA